MLQTTKTILTGSVALAIILLLHFFSQIFNKEEIYYHLFSLVIQGFLPLAALLGALTIFHLQSLENKRWKIADSLSNYLSDLDKNKDAKYTLDLIGSHNEILNNKRVLNEILGLNESGKEKSEEKYREKMLESLNLKLSNGDRRLEVGLKGMFETIDQEWGKGGTRNEMTFFVALSLINVFIALLLIPFTPILANQHRFIGTISVSLILILSTVAIYYAIKIAKRLIGWYVPKYRTD